MSQKTKPPIAQLKQPQAQNRQLPNKPVVAQSKNPVVQPIIRRPQAPPVYRPQLTPRVLQTKTLEKRNPPIAESKGRLISAAVPRTQTMSKIVQAKRPTGQSKQATVAPPVYRPQPVPRVLQSKVYIPGQSHFGLKEGTNPKVSIVAQSSKPQRTFLSIYRYTASKMPGGNTIQALDWRWNGKKWQPDKSDKEVYKTIKPPEGAGRQIGELRPYVMPPTATMKKKADEAKVKNAEVATNQPLSSAAYRWNGHRWSRAGETGKVTTKGAHEEVAAYEKAGGGASGAWIGFVQNAWPCKDQCMPYFIRESKQRTVGKKKTIVPGVSFVFNITGNSAGFSGDHDKAMEKTMTGEIWIVNGTSYLARPGSLGKDGPAKPPS